MFRAVFALVALLAAPRAFAETGLGHAGQLTVSSDLALNAGFSWTSGAGTASRWGFGAGGDYFVRDDVSAGLAFAVRAEKYDDAPQRISGTGRARLGWYHPLNAISGFWTRASLGASTSPSGNGQPSATTLDAAIDAVLAMTPAEHIFVAFGPSFRRDLANWRGGETIGGRVNSIALSLAVGAYF